MCSFPGRVHLLQVLFYTTGNFRSFREFNIGDASWPGSSSIIMHDCHGLGIYATITSNNLMSSVSLYNLYDPLKETQG